MPRKRLTAAEYVEEHTEVPLIIGDLVEHLGSALQHWAVAVSAVRTDPDAALTHLVNAEIDINGALRIGRAELIRVFNEASDRLDAELPDVEDNAANPS